MLIVVAILIAFMLAGILWGAKGGPHAPAGWMAAFLAGLALFVLLVMALAGGPPYRWSG